MCFNLDDNKVLNKLCDNVINTKASVEDPLEEDEYHVSSAEVTAIEYLPAKY